MDEMEKVPGFFEIDLVAHCGHSLKGEHAWTLTATDVYLGWTVNIAIRNRAHTRVVAAIEEVTERLPYLMVGLDVDNGGEFINHALIGWCADRTIFMTRARAHTSNDNAHVEQKNGDIVRKSAFRYRYDTPEELDLLNELWGFVNLRKNLFLATKKAVGWRSTKAGRNTRTYDKPKTPYQRLREEPGFLSEEAAHRLQVLYAQTNPADLTRNINRIQQALILSAKDKTLTLRDQAS
jgi:transposase InsO family protein